MTQFPPDKIRNIAIVAHVDHGKTTLVDAMLWQSGIFRDNETVDERAMDSMDQERERGITILAKNTAVERDGYKINIIDTPGHADFGGEVERGLTMVDGVLLLVDASEGPLPQTRYVVEKALRQQLPVIVVVNKIDRPDARIDAVVDEVYELFMDLDATDDQIDFPIVYTNARDGIALADPADEGDSLDILFELIYKSVPAPGGVVDAPLQAHVTNLDASPYLGRLAICRIHNGEITKGGKVAWTKPDGSHKFANISELFVSHGMERVPAASASAGDIIAVAGIDDVMIGDTLCDTDNPDPLPGIAIDEPSISMVVGINSSPLVGESGTKLTARQLQDRLAAELVGNVTIQVEDVGRRDAWEVRGRGEMQLSVLVETLRREGFELTVEKPRVLTREVDGKLHEPMEHVVIDIPEEHVGAITQLLTARKGQMANMINHGTGWVRLEYTVPARGLIGFRTKFLTDSRGTGIMHQSFHGYEPWAGEFVTRQTGSMVADRPGDATTFAIRKLEDRGQMMITPGEKVYEGRIVGENARSEDMDVNIVRDKKLTNMRAASGDILERLQGTKSLSLEEALEFISDDEAVEVTPEAIRLRKVELNATRREMSRSKQASGKPMV